MVKSELDGQVENLAAAGARSALENNRADLMDRLKVWGIWFGVGTPVWAAGFGVTKLGLLIPVPVVKEAVIGLGLLGMIAGGIPAALGAGFAVLNRVGRAVLPKYTSESFNRWALKGPIRRELRQTAAQAS